MPPRFLTVILIACSSCLWQPAKGSAEAIHADSGWSLEVNSATGDFDITSAVAGWKVGGTIGFPLSEVTEVADGDAIGAFQSVRFKWQDGGRRSGSIRLYQNRPLAQFAVKFEDAAQGTPKAFPILTRLPERLMAFRYGETDHLRPELFHLQGSVPDEQYGGPFALFNDHAETMIISPASNFMVAMMSGDLEHGISSGLNRTLDGASAGYEQRTLLAINHGINQTWSDWGHGLTDLYGKRRPANDSDIGLKYIGYWTDNGSHYYYNYDSERGYAGTLLNVKDYFIKRQIPIHYMQLDSWWYPKTFDSLQKKESDKPRSKDPKSPAGSWNRYGGLLEYTGAKELFENGLGEFQKQLGMPLIVHNRWIDPKSPYRASYRISGIAAVDPRWWDKITGDISGWGVTTYEQDWNNYIYLRSPELMNTTWAGDAYMDGMANACAAHQLSMQYCMVMPRFVLQGGAKYPSLTTVRVSGDRLERGKWREFFYGSTLASALGVWPWTDVYRSGETPNILISNLSAGMVGLSDRIGDEDATNIFRCIRRDGVIVKPDAPLTPSDASFIQAAHAEMDPAAAPAAVVCTTSSTQGSMSAWYVFACTAEHKKVRETDWSLGANSLGLTGSAVAYDYFSGVTQMIDSDHSLSGRLDNERDWSYQIVAPIGRSGIALLGDTGLFVMRGRQRISKIIDDGDGSLRVVALFAHNESSVTLAAYAPSEPAITAKNGLVDDIHYVPDTKLVRFRVHPSLQAEEGSVTSAEVSIHLR